MPLDRPTRYRWIICALLFFAITINYIDRLVFGLLVPELQRRFGWSNAEYADIAFWFEVAYAIGLVSAGRVLDWTGTRWGFAVALVGGSAASALHAAVSTILGFSAVRFLLGLFEAGAFPAAVKATAEWFPRRERALVAGFFTAGASLGAILAPLVVPWLLVQFGWQAAFIVTGAAGLLWLVFWLRCYHLPAQHPRVSLAEQRLIHADVDESGGAPVPWLRLFTCGPTWGFLLAKFFTDSVWRWYLYVLPLFFSQTFQLNIRDFGLPFLIIYSMADLGSIAGGWLSSRLIARGWSVNRARKSVMTLCSCGVLPVMFCPHVSNLWISVLLVGLAAAAHQGFSCTIFTVVSDVFPKRVIGSVVGIGGTAGALGAMLLLTITSHAFQTSDAQGEPTRAYGMLFMCAALAYGLATLSLHVFSPRLAPVLAGGPSANAVPAAQQQPA